MRHDRKKGGRTERVDTPEASLREDLVLVHRNERTCCKTVSTLLLSSQRTNAPRVLGVSFWNKIELVGRLPSKTLLFNSASLLASAPSSALTVSSSLPNASASGWAKKLERRIWWWRLLRRGFWDSMGARKSAGMSLVPWWMSCAEG